MDEIKKGSPEWERIIKNQEEILGDLKNRNIDENQKQMIKNRKEGLESIHESIYFYFDNELKLALYELHRHQDNFNNYFRDFVIRESKIVNRIEEIRKEMEEERQKIEKNYIKLNELYNIIFEDNKKNLDNIFKENKEKIEKNIEEKIISFFIKKEKEIKEILICSNLSEGKKIKTEQNSIIEKNRELFILPNCYKKKITGIYFLLKDNIIVYIGQSKNIIHRVHTHMKDKDFNRVLYFLCDKNELDKEEQRYIEKYKPLYNKNKSFANKLY